QLFQELSLVYHRFQNLSEKARLYHKLDSVYRAFDHAANRRFELGETNYLEKVTAQAKQRQIANAHAKIQAQVEATRTEIGSLVQGEGPLDIPLERRVKLDPVNTLGLTEAETAYLDQRAQLSLAQRRLEGNRLLP